MLCLSATDAIRPRRLWENIETVAYVTECRPLDKHTGTSSVKGSATEPCKGSLCITRRVGGHPTLITIHPLPDDTSLVPKVRRTSTSLRAFAAQTLTS